jgi:hypothetical protein
MEMEFNHKIDLSFDGDQVTATCTQGDWTLTDTWIMVLTGARDHQFEKDHGVILD